MIAAWGGLAAANVDSNGGCKQAQHWYLESKQAASHAVPLHSKVVCLEEMI